MSGSTDHPRRPPVDIQGASEYLGLPVSWIRRACQERRIPFLRPAGGRRVLFDLDDLDVVLQNARVEPLESDWAPRVTLPDARSARARARPQGGGHSKDTGRRVS